MAIGIPVAAASLPNFIVIKSNSYPDEGYAYYKEDGSSTSVVIGEPSVFSTLVKIEVERATVSNKYVNLRFCYSNRFWVQKAEDRFIVAEPDQPQEDVTKASCTLFEAFQVDDDMLYLVHVQSGGRLLIDGPTMAFYVGENPSATANANDDQGYVSFVDWNTLIKLPTNAAFMGSNGKYLKNHYQSPLYPSEYLVFVSDDPNELESTHTVELQKDGHVRIKTYYHGYWVLNRISDGIVMVTEGRDDHTEEKDRLTGARDFWPIKIDDNTIALRNKQSNGFCANDYSDISLYATATSLKKEARIQVKELQMGRKINNVRYLMEYARIYDEAPFVAGRDVLINDTNQEATLTAEVSYQDEKSYTFSHSTTLTAGVKTDIKCGVPFIAEGKIEVSFEISENLQWDTTTTKTIQVTGSAGVPVPPLTTTVVEYVGTRGTCNIPYTYTQEDQSSVDGRFARFDQTDGIYNGVSYYNFSFHVISNQPINP